MASYYNRSVQIHPTRHCNLACRHCYSSSGPTERETVPQALLDRLVDDMPGQGYGNLAVSGGEPLLWRHLSHTLTRAKAGGLVTSLTSNGIPLTARRLGALAGVLDLLAISLDGVPSSHDRMRGSEGAFEAMSARLPGVRASGVPFGFLFTLTNANLGELAWVAQFAIDEGASLLQVHPLEEVGRAARGLAGERPGEIAANRAYLAYMRLQDRLGERLRLHLDLAHLDVLRDEQWRAHAGTAADGPLLADLVTQVVVEPDGAVVPMQFGFPRAYGVGSLHNARLPVLAGRWRRSGGFERYRRHCRSVAGELATTGDGALPAFNWHEMIAAAPVS